MEQVSKEKRRFKFPETATLLVLLIVLAALLTYLVPAGAFDRAVDEATGRTLVVAGTYHQVESTPTSFMQLIQSVYNGMLSASDIAWFIFVVGGAFGIITKSGAITAGLNKMIGKYQGRESLLIVFIMAAFAIGGMSYGMGEEVIPFVAILVPIAIKMGYDPVVGVSMAVVALYSGYSAGALNPFNTGVAQSICDLPLFSGIGLRLILGVGALAIAVHHTMRYGKKFKSSGVQLDLSEVPENLRSYEERAFTKTDGIILCVLAATIVILVIGVLKFDWYLSELAGLFLLMGIVTGLIYFRGNFGECINEFVIGCRDIATAAVLVCLSRAILVVLENGQIMDTLIYWISIPLTHVSSVVAAWGMYIAMGIVNFIIPSSSGQAVVVMPIMSSLGDLIGVTRQTAVLAFECGDGYWNMITPTHPILMASLGLAGVPFSKWFKFALPLVVKWSVWVLIVLAAAVLINWGPF